MCVFLIDVSHKDCLIYVILVAPGKDNDSKTVKYLKPFISIFLNFVIWYLKLFIKLLFE